MKKALIIIDVQNDYFPNGKMELFESEKVLIKIKELLNHFRKNNELVYFIQHISTRKEATFFLPDTIGVEIHNDIKPLKNEKIIQKNFPNSFLKTELQSELEKNSVKELVICGMMTHMCVDTTVRASMDFGYKVTLIKDGCTTRDLEWEEEKISSKVIQKVYLASLNNVFANIVNTKEYLENN